jgi:lipid II:glycine glycyltransferase (peptidoglycan interpeptide bridge formation enzyme)
MYDTHTIHDRCTWEEFVHRHSRESFMQTWEWGAFQERYQHEKVYRLGAKKGGKLIAVVQATVVSSRRGKFLAIAHGPVICRDYVLINETTCQTQIRDDMVPEVSNILRHLYEELIKIAKHEKCSFIRTTSTFHKESRLQLLFKGFQLCTSPIYLTSENAHVILIHQKNDQELLAGMRKTTRNILRNLDKYDLHIMSSSCPEALNDFIALYHTTVNRSKFIGFSDEYLRGEFHTFGSIGQAEVHTVFHKSEPLASAIIVTTQHAAFYHHGASKHSKIPATYALQWYIMKKARDRGLFCYNMWGTFIPGRTPRRWTGLTSFKEGFGGHTWMYAPSFDLVLNPFVYQLTSLYERYLRFKRGV